MLASASRVRGREVETKRRGDIRFQVPVHPACVGARLRRGGLRISTPSSRSASRVRGREVVTGEGPNCVPSP